MALCLVALGANVGDRSDTLSRAVELLAVAPQCVLRAQSAWQETPAVGGPTGQQPYLNAAVLVETSLAPLALLARLTEIEAALGRVRSARWGPRTVDLDLLLHDDAVISTPRLTLPHPRMAFRRFVIEPAAEIAPAMRHPLIGWTLEQLRDHLRHATLYVAVAGIDREIRTTLASNLAAQFGARIIRDPEPHVPAMPASDSAGREYAAEIELLGTREKLLDPAHWAEPARLAVSDFWLEQSRALAALWHADRHQGELATAVDAACAVTVRPKLLILLDPGPCPSKVEDNNVSYFASSDDLRRALTDVARRPGVGPLLELTGADEAANLAEAAAAIAAMS